MWFTLFITGRKSSAWDTITGLTALAMNSTPTKLLENTSAGISNLDTLRNLVSVRGVEKHERLELVFEKDEDIHGLTRRVRVGQAY